MKAFDIELHAMYSVSDVKTDIDLLGKILPPISYKKSKFIPPISYKKSKFIPPI